MKIPVESVEEVDAPETEEETVAPEVVEEAVDAEAEAPAMTEEEMVEAAIRAGEEAAENDFKFKYEKAVKELEQVRHELEEAAEAPRPLKKRRRTPSSVTPACRRTGRIIVAAPPASAMRSAIARPRSL